VHGLAVQIRRRPDRVGGLGAQREHVSGHVASVHIQAGGDIGHEQAAGSAGDIERRLPGLDELPELVDP
jgi:hypothetical protein